MEAQHCSLSWRYVTIAFSCLALGAFWQLYLPISYYVRCAPTFYESSCAGSFCDQFDERFAWRMFSPLSQRTWCTTNFFDAKRKPIAVDKLFHSSWISLLSKCRAPVRCGMTAFLCQRQRPLYRRTVLTVEGPNSTSTLVEDGLRNVCEDF